MSLRQTRYGSPKEIVLTAGGSQLKINGDGIFTTTGGKFESKAGQHSFVGGATVNAELPKMPESGMYSMRFDLSQIFDPNILKNMKYKLTLYTTNFTEPLSYQDSAFLKLPKFP